jgi:hypothetical protein
VMGADVVVRRLAARGISAPRVLPLLRDVRDDEVAGLYARGRADHRPDRREIRRLAVARRAPGSGGRAAQTTREAVPAARSGDVLSGRCQPHRSRPPVLGQR